MGRSGLCIGAQRYKLAMQFWWAYKGEACKRRELARSLTSQALRLRKLLIANCFIMAAAVFCSGRYALGAWLVRELGSNRNLLPAMAL